MLERSTWKRLWPLIFSLFVCLPTSRALGWTHRSAPANGAWSRQKAVTPDDKALTFQQILADFSADAHVTIVAEGIPLHPTLTDKAAQGLALAISSKDSSAKSARLTEIAAAFDYDCVQSGPHLYLLKKKYSDSRDLPCVTYDEIVHALNTILDETDLYSSSSPVKSSELVSWSLYDSLDDKQRSQMRSGLALADLNDAQRTLALVAAQQVLADQAIKYLRDVRDELRLLGNKRTVFERMTLDGLETFGFAGPFNAEKVIRVYPLNNAFTSQFGGAYMHTVLRASNASAVMTDRPPVVGTADFGFGFAEREPLADPTIPGDEDRALAHGMLSGRLSSTQTLLELASEITKSGYKVSVLDAIAEKPVCLFGQSCCSSEELLQSISALYGLDFATDDPGGRLIKLRHARNLRDPSATAAELVRLTPVSLLDYCAGQEAQLMKILPPTHLPGMRGDPHDQQNKQLLEKARHGKALLASTKAIYFPAVRRLLVLALPAIPARESPPVAVVSLEPEVRRLISFILLSGPPFDQLIALQGFTPSIALMHPEKMCIQMTVVNRGKLQINGATFGYRDDAGEFHSEGFLSGSRDMPPQPNQFADGP